MAPELLGIIGAAGLVASVGVTTVLAVAPADVDHYSEQLGSGNGQQILALMLVVMVLAVIALSGAVWGLFQKLLRMQEDAHKARDEREDKYSKSVERFADVVEGLQGVVSKCHDRTVTLEASNHLVVAGKR